METIASLRLERDELQDEKEALLSLVTSQQMEIIKLKKAAREAQRAVSPPATPPIHALHIPTAAPPAHAVDSRFSVNVEREIPVMRNTVASTAPTVDSRLSASIDRELPANPLVIRNSVSSAPTIEGGNKRSIILDHAPVKPAKKKTAATGKTVASLLVKKRKLATKKSVDSVPVTALKRCESTVAIEQPKTRAKRQKIEETIVVEESGNSLSSLAPPIAPIAMEIEFTPAPVDSCTDAGILDLTTTDNLDILLTRCFKKLCYPDRIWRILSACWRLTEITGIPITYRREKIEVSKLTGSGVDLSGVLHDREEAIVCFIWFFKTLSKIVLDMMARHLCGFDEGSLYRHKAFNQASAYTGICRLLGDHSRMESLVMRIMRENESVSDNSRVFSDYCCTIYRNIMHVWPDVFGNSVAFNPGSTHGVINLIMRRVTGNFVEDHLITTCLAIRRIHEGKDCEALFSVIAFETTVLFCGLIGGDDGAELKKLADILPVICHHISWKDTQAIIEKLWPFMTTPLVITLVASLARQGYNHPKRISRENVDWMVTRFSRLLASGTRVGIQSAFAGGVLDMVVGRDDYWERVQSVLCWYIRVRGKEGVGWEVRSECEAMLKGVSWEGGIENGGVLL